MKSDDSRISNPEIRNLKLDGAFLAAHAESNLRFRISGFEILESSDFKIFTHLAFLPAAMYLLSLQFSEGENQRIHARRVKTFFSVLRQIAEWISALAK